MKNYKNLSISEHLELCNKLLRKQYKKENKFIMLVQKNKKNNAMREYLKFDMFHMICLNRLLKRLKKDYSECIVVKDYTKPIKSLNKLSVHYRNNFEHKIIFC